MNIEWLESIASFAVTAFANGVWVGLLLVAMIWCAVRFMAARLPINATTRFSIWITLFVVCTGLVAYVGIQGQQGSEASVISVPSALAPQAAAPAPAALAPIEPPTAPVAEAPAVPKPLRPALPSAASPPAPVEGVAPTPPAQDEANAPATLSVIEAPSSTATAVEEPVGIEIRQEAEQATMGMLALPKMTAIPRKIELPAVTSFWRVVLFTMWGTIAGMLLMRIGTGLVGVRKIKQNSYAAPARVVDELNRLLAQMDKPRPVRVAISDELQTAVAAGFRQPYVLLPAHMLGSLSQLELRQVLLHEVAHLQRWDDWTMLMQRVVLALLFFHPGLIVLGRLMNRDREFACDDWVIAMTRKPKAYASCLAKLVAQHVRRPTPVIVPGFSSPKEELFDRVKTILDKKRTISFRLSKKAYAGLITVMTLLLIVSVQVLPVIALPEQPEMLPAFEPETLAFELDNEATEVPIATLSEPTMVDVPAEDLAAVVPAPDEVFAGFDNEPVLSVEDIKVPEAISAVASESNYSFEISSSQPNASSNGSVIVAGNNLASVSGYTYETRLSYESSDAALPLPRAAAPQVSTTAVTRTTRDTTALSSNAMTMLLRSAKRIPSSGDKAQLLIQAAQQASFNQSVTAAFLGAVDSIPSSGDKVRALMAMAEREALDGASAVLFLDSIAKIPSNGDKTRVLLYSLNNKVLPLKDEAVRDRCLDVIEGISSSSDYRRAMSAVLEHMS